MLAAGPGKRLRPLTYIIPKPLTPISRNYSPLTYLIEILKTKFNINNIHIILGYCSKPYSKYLSKLDVNIIVDDELRGTAGHILTLAQHVKNVEDILLINGDLYISENCIRKILSSIELCRNYDITIFTLRRSFKYGVIEHRENSVQWIEKPKFNTVTGIYYIKLSRVLPVIQHLSNLRKVVDMNMLVSELSRYRYAISCIDLNCDEDDIIDIGTHIDYIKILSLLSEDNI